MNGEDKTLNYLDRDKMEEECGVFGIYKHDKERTVAQLLYYGLYALQHRGQESAGIATNKDGKIHQHKGMGLVNEVFRGGEVGLDLAGNIGVGHVRYSTEGESHIENAQPLVVSYKNSHMALAHNGNLVNARALREMLEDNGVVFQTTTDSEVMLNLIARGLKNGLVESIKRMVEMIKGAYALVITTEDKLIAIRDPHGMRPLCMGKSKNGYVFSSETCGLDAVGAEYVRDLEPGEIVIVDEEGVNSYAQTNWAKKKLCIFELIYFARPDSVMDGISVYRSRHNAGKILSRENPVEADVVIGVPDSGMPAAIGYAEASGIPFGMGLIKNKYIGRTFIQPNQELREEGVRIKLNVLKANVEGKRVVIVDDSIVRGTTSKRLVEMLREAGASEVHFRVSSPPVTHTCHFGIDTPYRKDLVGAMHTVEEIREMIGADTLAFITTNGLVESVGGGNFYCKACFDGDYPMEVPVVEE
ncbi:amidophosphoribosyltransferase [Alkalibacter rhizosphaerae]|uniref:Amidophosphoribosyltransferase n=1 Tax=Alkalibacter rhizosphaerae TaxID=2815577 RepID=A0A974XCR0_9FIRM|nr:amidophosphoribosyltransferase [Alkalibacter rhizosphaerae]QSX07427.1 amidophosphoribosyltransferase [Alkalibacter rhizosphaerae]